MPHQVLLDPERRTVSIYPRPVSFSDLASDITDGDHLPPPKSPTGVPFITIGNIAKQTRKIDFADTFAVPQAYYNALKPNKKPKKGDVLYTVTGSFGIPVIVNENVGFCFQRDIGMIRPNSEMNSKWLYYLLLSPQVFKQANDGATGTAQKTVSLKLLRSFEVPKEGPKQQQTEVAKLDALSAETQHLESIYKQKLEALEALKKRCSTRLSRAICKSSMNEAATRAEHIDPALKAAAAGMSDIRTIMSDMARPHHNSPSRDPWAAPAPAPPLAAQRPARVGTRPRSPGNLSWPAHRGAASLRTRRRSGIDWLYRARPKISANRPQLQSPPLPRFREIQTR